MRELRKLTHNPAQGILRPSTFTTEVTINGKKELLDITCPHDGFCKESCAWYSEQPNSVSDSPKSYKTITLILCKGKPIGKLVEEEENKGRFGYATDENSL